MNYDIIYFKNKETLEKVKNFCIDNSIEFSISTPLSIFNELEAEFQLNEVYGNRFKKLSKKNAERMFV